VIKQEEPCEERFSSTVPWEREGEIPLRDPIRGNAKRKTRPFQNKLSVPKLQLFL
jgi:hypothetical protein